MTVFSRLLQDQLCLRVGEWYLYKLQVVGSDYLILRFKNPRQVFFFVFIFVTKSLKSFRLLSDCLDYTMCHPLKPGWYKNLIETPIENHRNFQSDNYWSKKVAESLKSAWALQSTFL